MLWASHCCFPVLWMSGRFYKFSEGSSREFDVHCPSSLGGWAVMGSLLGARGNMGLLSDLF